MNNRFLQIATLCLQSTLYSVVGICLLFSLSPQFQYLSFTELQHCHQIHELLFCCCYFYLHLQFNCSKRWSVSFSCECVFAGCTAVPKWRECDTYRCVIWNKKKRMVMGQRINYYFPIMHLKLHLQLRAVANSSGILYCIRRVEWIHPSRTLSTLQSKCQNVVRYGKFHAHVPSRPFCSVSHGDDFYRFRKISYLCLDNGNGHE